MKNFIVFKVVVVLSIMVSCDQDQEVAPIVTPENKAVITIERIDGGSSTVTEGDILEYSITSSKMLETAVDITTAFTDAAGVDDHDVVITGGVLSPYTISTTMTIEVVADGFPEPTEALALEIGAFDIADNWQLNPSTDIEAVDLQVANVNEEGVITIGLSWPNHDDDIDMYIFSAQTNGDWGGNDGATGSNPEINTNLWPSDTNGTYYVGIDPYHLEGTSTPYTFHIGFEDGTVQTIDGVFDATNLDAYAVDKGHYRLLKIDILDGAVTITHVNE